MYRGSAPKSRDLSQSGSATYQTPEPDERLPRGTAVDMAGVSLALWTPLWGSGPSNAKVSTEAGQVHICFAGSLEQEQTLDVPANGRGRDLDDQNAQDRERYRRLFIDVMQELYPGMEPREIKVKKTPDHIDRFLAALVHRPDWDERLWRYVIEVKLH